MKKAAAIFSIIVLFIGVSATRYMAAPSNLPQGEDINSVSIAFFNGEEMVYQNRGQNITEQSVFELASNGKLIAAYAAMQLVDDGILELDSKIIRYLPENLKTKDTRMNDITLRQLLAHTAGFSPSFEFGTDKKIYSSPGTKFMYSGVGYIYLQAIIENATASSFENVVQKYVFSYLGMSNSTFEAAKTVTPYMNSGSAFLYAVAVFFVVFLLLLGVGLMLKKAFKSIRISKRKLYICSFFIAGILNSVFLLFFFVSKVLVIFLICFAMLSVILYVFRKTKRMFFVSVPVAVITMLACSFIANTSIPVTNDLLAKPANAAYTLKSTSKDMALFCSALLSQYHGNNGGEGMFEKQIEIDPNNAWGLGVGIENTDGKQTYWHSGINPGFQSLLVLCPSQNQFVIILTNDDKGLAYANEVARQLLNIEGKWMIPRA